MGIREHGPPYTNIDYIEAELAGPPSEVRDIAIINVESKPKSVIKGGPVYINVTVANHGNTDEFFNVTTYYDQTVIETRLNVFLSAGANQILMFTWDTAGATAGTYTIRVEATELPGETYIADNSRVDGTVTVSLTPVHDVAITNVTASPVTAIAGEIVNITVATENEGTEAESFQITSYANTTIIGSRTVILDAGASASEVFSWNTTEALGVYLIRAEADPVQGETDTTDNTFQFDGAVAVFTYPVEFPVASFVWTPTNPSVGESVTFDGTGSLDPDGNIVSYQWDFGDGNYGTGSITTHAYSNNGTYTVTLRIVDNDGLFDTAANQVSVKQAEAQPFPSIEIMIILGITAIVAVAAIVMLLARSRSRS